MFHFTILILKIPTYYHIMGIIFHPPPPSSQPSRVILRDQVTKQQRSYVTKQPYIQELYQNQRWCINFDRDKSQKNYQYALSLINCSQYTKTIYICDQKSQEFIYSLLPINFPNLQKVSLNSNKLSSIEPICQLNAPRLMELSLDHNFFISIKTLPKMYAKITVLNIRGNKVTSLRDCLLEKMSFHPHVDSINFEDQKTIAYGDDARWWLKMPFQTIHRVCNSFLKIQPQIVKQGCPLKNLFRFFSEKDTKGKVKALCTLTKEKFEGISNDLTIQKSIGNL